LDPVDRVEVLKEGTVVEEGFVRNAEKQRRRTLRINARFNLGFSIF
jgi:hypothetical protein